MPGKGGLQYPWGFAVSQEKDLDIPKTIWPLSYFVSFFLTNHLSHPKANLKSNLLHVQALHNIAMNMVIKMRCMGGKKGHTIYRLVHEGLNTSKEWREGT